MSDGTDKAARAAALTPDLCVIGAGARGIALASAAAAFGVPVVLIDRGAPGGSEAELVTAAFVAAGAQAQATRLAGRSGIAVDAATLRPEHLHDHVQRVLALPAAHARTERLTALGLTVLRGEARFLSRHMVTVGDQRIRARRFVLATGSRPIVPPEVSGLDPSRLLTEDGLAGLTRLPERLAVLGGGARAVALGQALQRLGSVTSVIAPDGLLPGEDPEAVMILRRQLLRDGLTLIEDGDLLRAEGDRKRVRLVIGRGGDQSTVEADSLLVPGDAREPDIATLDLDLAGIGRDADGAVVDAGLRSANRRVYALGSCAGGAAAGAGAARGEDHVGIVLGAVLFRRAGRLAPERVARIVRSRPEIATIGSMPGRAPEPGRLRFLRWPFAETPGALATGETEGFVKIASDRNGRIRGVTIVGEGAGEAIAPWCVALKAGLTVQAMAETALPGLSRAEASRRAALAFHMPATRSPAIRRLIGLLRRLG